MSVKHLPARQTQRVKYSDNVVGKEGLISGESLEVASTDIATLKEDVATMKAGAFSSGLSVTGDIKATGDATAKTFNQSEANLTIIATPTMPTDCSVTPGTVPYVSLKVINGVLWINVVIKITNNGENAYSGPLTLFPSVAIPEELAAKIYRLDGSTVNQAMVSGNFITRIPAFQNSEVKVCVVASYAPNVLQIYIDSASIAANGFSTYAMRGALTLL